MCNTYSADKTGNYNDEQLPLFEITRYFYSLNIPIIISKNDAIVSINMINDTNPNNISSAFTSVFNVYW